MTDKKTISFLFFSALVFALFVYLGIWQLQRLEQKNNVIKTMQDSLLAVDSDVTIDYWPLSAQPYDYVRLRGELDQSKPLFRPGAINPNAVGAASRLGYNLFMPLVVNDRAVLIDFGWIDPGMRDLLWRNARQNLAHKIPVTVSGWVMPQQLQKTFTPDNNPLKNEWYWQDWDQINSFTGYVFVPFVLYNQLNWFGSSRPPVWDIIPNNHREYAWTWFGLALVQMAASGFYIAKQRG